MSALGPLFSAIDLFFNLVESYASTKAVSFKTDITGMLSSQKMCRIFHNSSLWITLRGTWHLLFNIFSGDNSFQSLRTGFGSKQTEKKNEKLSELSLKNTVIIALLEPHLRCAYSIKNMIFPPFPLSLPSFFPLPLLLPFLLLLLLLVLLFFSWLMKCFCEDFQNVFCMENL